MAMSFAACNGGHGEASADGFDTVYSQAKADSLVRAFGEALGASVKVNAIDNDSAVEVKEVIKGMQYAMAADTTKSFMLGLQVGMTVLNQIQNLANNGVAVDQDILLNALRQTMTNDTLSQSDLRAYMTQYQIQEQDLTSARRKFERAKLEQAPEAIANAQSGKNYIDSIAALNPSIVMLPSGVGVIVENPGSDEKLTASSRASMNFTISNAAGRVIEQTSQEPRLVRVGSRPEGFQQGVALLGAGGKATIYVPGPLAYGVEDARQRYGLEPNEMLIYQVEVVEVQ